MSRVGFLNGGPDANPQAWSGSGASMHCSRTTEGMRRTAAAFGTALTDAFACACKFGSGPLLTHDAMMRFLCSVGVLLEPGTEQPLLLFMGSALPRLARVDVLRLLPLAQSASSSRPSSASSFRPPSAKVCKIGESSSTSLTFQNFVDCVLLVCNALLLQLNLQVYNVNGDISQHLSLCLNSVLSAALGHDVQPQPFDSDDTAGDSSVLSSIQRFPPHLVARVMAVLRNGSVDSSVTVHSLRAAAAQLPLQPPLDDATLTSMFEEAAGGGNGLTLHHLTIATSLQFKYRRYTQQWRRLFEAVIRAKMLPVNAAPQPVPLLNLQKITAGAPPSAAHVLQRKPHALLLTSGFRMRPAAAPSIFTLSGQRLADAAPPAALSPAFGASGVRDMFALERSSASFGPNLAQKFQSANGSLLQTMTQSFQLPAKVAAQQLAVNRINTMILESSVPRQQPQPLLSAAATTRKPRPVSAPVTAATFSSSASALSWPADSGAAAASAALTAFSRHAHSSPSHSLSNSARAAAVRPFSAVASHAGVEAAAQSLSRVSIIGGHMNLSVAGGQQLLQPQSSAVAAPARVARAASAPRLLASSTRLGTRATSAPRRAQVAVAGVDDEDEEGVTIDDGDGDGGEEVLLAMGNAINRWGRDKNSGIGRGAASRTGSVTAAGDGSADVPLPSSVMAKMGLLPDSMLQQQPEAPAPTVSFAAQAKFNSFYSSAALPVRTLPTAYDAQHACSSMSPQARPRSGRPLSGKAVQSR